MVAAALRMTDEQQVESCSASAGSSVLVHRTDLLPDNLREPSTTSTPTRVRTN